MSQLKISKKSLGTFNYHPLNSLKLMYWYYAVSPPFYALSLRHQGKKHLSFIQPYDEYYTLGVEVGMEELDSTLAATDGDLASEGWSLSVDKPLVCGAGGKRLDIVV